MIAQELLIFYQDIYGPILKTYNLLTLCFGPVSATVRKHSNLQRKEVYLAHDSAGWKSKINWAASESIRLSQTMVEIHQWKQVHEEKKDKGGQINFITHHSLQN